MTVHISPPHERPLLIWSLTAVVIVGVVLTLVGMILNAWLLLGLAAACAALGALALVPAGVMAHVTTSQSASRTTSQSAQSASRTTSQSASRPTTDRRPH